MISTELSGHHSASHKPKTILIADDNEMVRTKIRQAIERDTDFEVCGESTDGTDAVSMAKALSPDLIILDLRMPGLNGVEVAGILRYAQPKIRIVLVTMYAEDLAKSDASVFRIDAILSKSYGLSELTEHVASLLAERKGETAILPDREARLAAVQQPQRPGIAGSKFCAARSRSCLDA